MPEAAGGVSLAAELERVARQRPLLVGVDFDGTIAPFAEHPSLARPHQSAQGALSRLLVAPGVHVAVISGRRREELVSFLGHLPGIALIGEHGSDTEETGSEYPDLGTLAGELGEIAADLPGSLVEQKKWSVVFHYRQADPDASTEAVQRVLDGPGREAGVVVRKGNMVVELHATDTNKGHAIDDLRDQVDAAAVIFFGDDVTDEEVFARLRPADVGVKVGRGWTLAPFRVEGVDQVASALHHLADLASG